MTVVGRAAQALVVVALVGMAGPARAQTSPSTWPVESPPAPLAAREVQFPPYEIRTLANGLRVVAVLHHEQPVVSLRLLVGAGSASDPPGTPGVANLLASVLDQGTTTRTAQEIAETIDTIGGGLAMGAGPDLTFANAVVMKDSFGLVMDLLADVVRHPALDPTEIERQRQQIASGLRVNYEDLDFVAGVVFNRLVYGFHPYGKPQFGSMESLGQISRDDLRAFHETYFAPNVSILAIVGDLTAEEAFDAAERVFGDWERQEIPATSMTEPPPPTRRIIVIDRPGAVQTEIRAGHLGVPRKHADYMALDLAVKILGGEGSNRLHRVLRAERSLTYGAEARMHTLKDTGDIEADTDTRSAATAEAVRLVIEEFWRLQRQRVHPRELSEAQAYLSGSFPLQIETPDAIAVRVLNVLFYDLDLEELQTYRERVTAVTVDDIQRVAREYLKPDRLSIVMVGDAATFIDDLPGVGLTNVERVALEELDLSAFELHRGSTPRPSPGSEPTRSEHEQAMAVITRAIEAKGGLDALRGVSSVTAEGQTTLFTPAGPMTANAVSYLGYPDRFRVEVNLPDGQIVQAYDAGRAWLRNPDGVQDAPPLMRDDFRASVQRDLIPLLLRANSGGFQMQLLRETVNGAVEVSADDFGPVRVYLDSNGLVARQTYRAWGPDGVQDTEELFSDYRTVDGVQVAFRIIVRRGGVSVMERQITEVTFNVQLAEDLFTKPSQ